MSDLADKDVQTAKQNVETARTCSGVSIIVDYVLSQTGGFRILEKAKQYLLSILTQRGP